jgi:predicted transcriptional regulator
MIVYIATNKLNGKRYIGATRHSVEYRRARHIYDSKNKNLCRVFGAALRKYGDDGFVWNILAECSSREEMMREEVRLIAEMKPEYNITIGGQGVLGVPYTDERRAKLSKALKGRKMTPAQRAANLILMRRLSVQHQRPIVCLTDGRFFASCKEACEFYGITSSNIRSVAAGEQATTKGLSFAFSDRPLSPNERSEKIRQLQQRKAANIKRQRASKNQPVLCLADGVEYENAKAAAKPYGITTGRVRQLCHEGGTTLSGVGFALVGKGPVQKKQLTPAQRADGQARRNAALKRSWLKTSKPVLCLDDNVVYDSISDAARAVGRCVESVSASIRRNGRSGGKRFRFVDRADGMATSSPAS